MASGLTNAKLFLYIVILIIQKITLSQNFDSHDWYAYLQRFKTKTDHKIYLAWKWKRIWYSNKIFSYVFDSYKTINQCDLPWSSVCVCAASLLHFGRQSGHRAVGVARSGRWQKVPSHLGRCGADFELTLSVQSTPSERRRRLKRRLRSLRSARAGIFRERILNYLRN